MFDHFKLIPSLPLPSVLSPFLLGLHGFLPRDLDIYIKLLCEVDSYVLFKLLEPFTNRSGSQSWKIWRFVDQALENPQVNRKLSYECNASVAIVRNLAGSKSGLTLKTEVKKSALHHLNCLNCVWPSASAVCLWEIYFFSLRGKELERWYAKHRNFIQSIRLRVERVWLRKFRHAHCLMKVLRTTFWTGFDGSTGDTPK